MSTTTPQNTIKTGQKKNDAGDSMKEKKICFFFFLRLSLEATWLVVVIQRKSFSFFSFPFLPFVIRLAVYTRVS